MANNIYAKSFAFTGEGYIAVETTPTVLTVTLVASTKNSGNVQLRVNGGSDVNFPPGGIATLRSVDISQLEVKGNLGHHLSIVGGSW
ncbi:MAG: hypothetical protein ACF8R9_12650 [Phycisphaerales bacterium JB054]